MDQMSDREIWAYIQEHDPFTAAELSGDVDSAVACFRLGGLRSDVPPTIELNRDETSEVIETLAAAVTYGGQVLVWVDTLDMAFKIKTSGHWSPPIGKVAGS
jgi:hypothetical protein